MTFGATEVAYALLSIGLVLAMYRMLVGPSTPDRIVALELTSMLSVGLILVSVIESGATLFLDVAIVLALVAFLGTIVFAHYVERGPRE